MRTAPHLLVALAASLGTASAQQPPYPGLRITAEIDGVDELRISHREAKWVHRAWSWPSAVTIQGRSWKPQAEPTLRATRGLPFVPLDIDLAGATLWKIRGRGRTTLGFGEDGLSIHFDDGGPVGAATYEVLVTFADAECEASRRYFRARELDPTSPATVENLEIDVAATIDGADAVRISAERVRWSHYDYHAPTEVSFDGSSWDPAEAPELPADASPRIPAFADLSGTTLVERHGRGLVRLEATAREVAIHFDDRLPGGAAPYRAKLRIPIRPLFRVEIRCGRTAAADGAELRVVRHPAGDGSPVLLPGQRIVGARGRAVVALAAGDYGFEVQHARAPDTVVALASPRTEIGGDRRVALRTLQTGLRVAIPGHGTPRIDEIGIRSILPTGEVSWRRSSPAADARLVLSPSRTYRVRVLAGRRAMRAALWLELPAGEFRSASIDAAELTSCSFRWRDGTPARGDAGVSLVFPDGSQELPFTAKTSLLTNRRFVELGYWYEVDPGRKVVFHPRGYVLPGAPAQHVLDLGGPLTGRASAAILTNENLGSADARQLWLDFGLQDQGGHAVDLRASDIDWSSTVQMRDGEPVPEPPLSAEARERLGNLTDTLLLNATYRLHEPAELSLPPVAWTPVQSERVSTTLPAYMDWRAKSYLEKAERSLREIAAVRGRPIDPAYRVRLRWWLNSGAVGGHGGFTMPIGGMTGDFSWYTHPWAISHELLHGLGYGHDDEMNRVDAAVQERFRRYRWFVADHPGFVPRALRE